MKMLQSSKYYMLGAGVSGASFTDGASKGLKFEGSIMCGYPVSSFPQSISYSQSTVSFEFHHSGFYNLNNVEHAKTDGCILACGSSTKTVPAVSKSVFGPLFTTTVDNRRWTYNLLVMPGETKFIRTSHSGVFNNLYSGDWFFALGFAWLNANTYVSMIGYPDLKGSKSIVGIYSFYATTFEVQPALQRVKSYSYSTNLRVSNITPELAFAMVRDILQNGLNGKSFSDWYPYSIYNSINGVSSYRSLPSRFGSFDFQTLFPEPNRNPYWPELARNAYNSVPSFKGNGIALSSDLLAMKSSVSSTTRLIKSLISSNATAKVIANVFLAFYYGWRLLVMDVGELSAAFSKASKLDYKQKCSSHLTYEMKGVSYTCYFHCYYNRYGANRSGIDQLVSMFDAKLSLENIWDLIPFSFVLDWFVDVGNALESIDSFGDLTQDHKIICTGRSIKCSVSRSAYDAGLNGWMGVVTYSYYKRAYTSYIFYPSLILGELNNPLHHVIEGGALIVSKR